MQSYIGRGRRWASLPDASLDEKWCATFELLAQRPSDESILELHNDLEAEILLRRRAPPIGRVLHVVDTFTQSTRAAMNEVQRRAPERFAAGSEALRDDLMQFATQAEEGGKKPN